MVVHVVHDAQGQIISMGFPSPPGADFRGPAFGVHARTNQHVTELDVPPEHSGLTIHELADKLQVDVKSKRLVAKP